jgi:hypothetical protein
MYKIVFGDPATREMLIAEYRAGGIEIDQAD